MFVCVFIYIINNYNFSHLIIIQSNICMQSKSMYRFFFVQQAFHKVF